MASQIKNLVTLFLFELQLEQRISKDMKIICAGYPKTGSKSCSAALRILGYNVCDFMETLEFASEIWEKYFNGEVSSKEETRQLRSVVLIDFMYFCHIINL